MNGDNMKDNICRDFLRNVCNRGNSCKFRHPEGDEAKALGKKELIFCHDFQNKECRRGNCRFIHCTKNEEEMYRSTGCIPEHLLEIINQKSGGQTLPSIPICKDYLKGECKRGSRCKFRHVSSGQYHMENNNMNLPTPRRPAFDSYDHPFDGFGMCEPLPKRQAYEDSFTSFGGSSSTSTESHSYLTQHVRLLQEENGRLMHKIDDLKKQVSDLTAQNQYLREQSEQIRGMQSTKEWYMSPYQNSYLS